MRAGIVHLLFKLSRPFFFLLHLLFQIGNLLVGKKKFLRQGLFAHTANFVFATVNRRLAMGTAKFHRLKSFSAESGCSVNRPARGPTPAPARRRRRARAPGADSTIAAP